MAVWLWCGDKVSVFFPTRARARTCFRVIVRVGMRGYVVVVERMTASFPTRARESKFLLVRERECM